jgi:hypothetical protein
VGAVDYQPLGWSGGPAPRGPIHRGLAAHGPRQLRVQQRRQQGVAAARLDPERDVSVARRIALRLVEGGGGLHCVWTGRRLVPATLDVDHMFPWSGPAATSGTCCPLTVR